MKLLALLGQLLPKHDAGEQGSMVESTTVAPASVTQAAEFPGQRDTVIIGTTHGISQEEYRIGQFHLKLHQAQVAAEQQRRLRNLALTERMLLNHKATSFVERNPDLRYVEGVVVDEAVALPGATVSSLPGPGQVIRLSAGAPGRGSSAPTTRPPTKAERAPRVTTRWANVGPTAGVR